MKEFVQALAEFDTLQGFLEHVSLVLDTSNDAKEDMVTLMTLHSAKGLEFDTVFLAGWEEGLFPHPRALNESASALEEERRLAYVGISRAKKRAFITYAYSRKAPQGWQNSRPSRFISELPADCIVHYNPNGSEETRHQQHYAATQKSLRALSPHTPHTSSLYHETQHSHDFKTGDKVYHERFGHGSVLAFEGDKILITFKDDCVRKIMSSFVEHA